MEQLRAQEVAMKQLRSLQSTNPASAATNLSAMELAKVLEMDVVVVNDPQVLRNAQLKQLAQLCTQHSFTEVLQLGPLALIEAPHTEPLLRSWI